MSIYKINKIAVYCGSSAGNLDCYGELAEKCADALSEKNITLVYGGGKIGMMGKIANRMLSNNAKVIGVIPKHLVDVELAHEKLTEIHVVNTMHERKAKMAELSDGFIMMPGGSGSLDEFFEVYTLAQLSYHAKPCGILNSTGYYDYLLKFLDHAVSQGFMKQIYRDMIILNESPSELIRSFENYAAPTTKKWTHESVGAEKV